MPDIFDQIHGQAGGDVFDQIHSQANPATVGGFLSNAVSSTGGLVSNLAHAVAHPIDTLRAGADVAAGAMNELGDLHGSTDPGVQKANAAFAAFKNNLKERYGSLDAMAHTLYHDPAGFLGDVATVAGGVEGAAGRAAELADTAKLAGAAKAARAVGGTAAAVESANPFRLATQPAAAGADAATSAMAKPLYESALKPNKRLDLPDYKATSEMGLKEGLLVGSEKSYARLQGLLSDVRSQIESGVQARTGVPAIDPNAVASRVDQMRGRFQTVNPAEDLRDIDRAKQEFLGQFQQPKPQASGLLGPNGQPIPAAPAGPARQMTLAEAQAMKTKTNATLAGKYGKQSEAGTEAQKALARGLKEEIEGLFPEIGALNERESKLLNLEPSLQAALKRSGSGDVIPTSGDVTAVLKKIMDRPTFKSGLAIALERAPQFAPSTGMKVSQRMALVESRLGQYLGGINDVQSQSLQNGTFAPQP